MVMKAISSLRISQLIHKPSINCFYRHFTFSYNWFSLCASENLVQILWLTCQGWQGGLFGCRFLAVINFGVENRVNWFMKIYLTGWAVFSSNTQSLLSFVITVLYCWAQICISNTLSPSEWMLIFPVCFLDFFRNPGMILPFLCVRVWRMNNM